MEYNWKACLADDYGNDVENMGSIKDLSVWVIDGNASCYQQLARREEETFLSQKSVQIQSYSEPICSFNWLLHAAGPTAEMLSSCHKKANCINLKRY